MLLIPPLRVLLRTTTSGPRAPRVPGQGLIVAANHQSWIDPYAVQVAILPHRITFLMTELFFDLPIAGFYFRLSGARRVREGGAPSVTGLRAAQEALAEGEIVCLFPEGELTLTGEIGKGQRGVARLARKTGAPVLPIGIHGAINVFSKIQTTPRLAHVRVRRGRLMRYDETPDKEGEERFTRRLMARITSLAE